MSLGHTYKFFGFYISYTILILPLSIFYTSFRQHTQLSTLFSLLFQYSCLTQILARKICCWGFSIPIPIHRDYRGPVGEKEQRGHSLKRRVPLSASAPPSRERESLPLSWPSFYWFSRPLTSKKVFFYYTKVCFRWLSLQTQERVSLNTSKEDICNVKGEVVQTLGSRPGRSSPDFRKIKIFSKHLLASGWGSCFSKSKFHSSLSTMQAWFPTGELIHGRGSCPPTSLPTGFSEWGLSHVSHAWNSSPHYMAYSVWYSSAAI